MRVLREVEEPVVQLRRWARKNPTLALLGALGTGILIGHPVTRKPAFRLLSKEFGWLL